MNRESPFRQLILFPGELPAWESLPAERQQASQEVLSRLLQQMLAQPTSRPMDHSPEKATEKHHV